jgi:hypothetical protein
MAVANTVKVKGFTPGQTETTATWPRKMAALRSQTCHCMCVAKLLLLAIEVVYRGEQLFVE